MVATWNHIAPQHDYLFGAALLALAHILIMPYTAKNQLKNV
ncbi:MAG: hypothetical protein WBW04_04865 [Nitrolancea sp.]